MRDLQIVQWFFELHPVWQAFIAGTFCWITTALGAAVVFLKKNVSRKFLDAALGFAAGIMIAASFWSLLEPSIEMAEALGLIKWLPAATGFILGALCIRIGDAYVPHLHLGLPKDSAEGIKTKWRRATLLVMAITLHNIPEGLAVGVLFGAAASGMDPTGTATVMSAIALAIGISIQNFPEGMAVSMPLRGEGVSRLLSFNYGQLSGIVNPPSAVIGALAVLFIQPLLPYALGFAAGAMIFVVVEELIPTSHRGGNADLATIGTIFGFSVMMILDVALG